MNIDYNLDPTFNQALTNGILQGYKGYLAVRKTASKELAVSRAYAWVKGNHIDSGVLTACQQLQTVDHRIAKAGYAWEYLQFMLKSSQKPYLIIIKNVRSTDKVFNGSNSNVSPENYLYKLADANNNLNISSAPHSENNAKQLQLELFPGETTSDKNDVSSLSTNISCFYVVTYEIDDESKMIKQIKLTMPNPQKKVLTQITDLTPLITESSVTIDPEELSVIQNDSIPDSEYFDDGQTFGYEIPTKEKNRNIK